MATPAKDVLKMIKDKEVKFVDLRFTDTRGKEQHVTVPVKAFEDDKFESGHAFDGSSIAGWKGIQASDMLLMPDPDTRGIDPFMDETTLIITCDVIEPSDGKGYERDPRSLAKRAEAYLKSTGLGDTAYFGPEPEFFIFDAVEWNVDMSGCYVQDHVRGSAVVHRREVRGRQHGPPAAGQGRLLPGAAGRLAAGHPLGDVPRAGADGRRGGSASPRSRAPGQCEIGTKFDDAGQARRLAADPQVRGAQHRARVRQDRDVHAEADRRRQRLGHARAPVGLEGRQEPVRRRRLRRAVRVRAVLHRRHHQARARRSTRSPIPGTNSYKRLVPGFEAPINLAYSARNRSAAIRIPYVSNPKGRRIEVRFPDPTANPYLAFSAMMMAGLDGVQNKIHPGDPMDKNLYDLPAGGSREGAAPCARRSTRRSSTSTRTASSSPAAACSPTT